MAVVKRPGTPEAHLEEAGAPIRITEPRHTIDLTSPGAPTMARKKAPKTGTYLINGDPFYYQEGTEFPEDVEAEWVHGPVASTDDEPEERADGPAPENRARGKAPENR